MNPSSSKWPTTAIRMTHVTCGGSWDLFTSEWPPMVTICTNCEAVLQLIHHDDDSKRISFRRI